MYKLLLACLLSFILVAFAVAGDGCTVISTPEGDIDLNDLADENGGKGFSLSVEGWTYNVRICKNFDTVPDCVPQKVVAAYQVPNPANLCHYMGIKNEKSTFTLADPANPTKGVSVKYMDGEVAFGNSRTTQVDVICDESDSKIFTCGPSGCEETVGNVINFHFTLKSKHGCPKKGSSAILWPVGILGIFLILSLFGFALYWPIGMVVNKFIRKKSGIEIIPNVAFWKDLPFLVRDGFLFLFKDLIYEKVIAVIVEKIRSRRQSYESA